MNRIDPMGSIWIEDEPAQDPKLYMANPSIQMVNSEYPILMSKKTIDLPPLPPTSYFQQAIDDMENKKSQGSANKKFLGMLKKLSLNSDKSPSKKKPAQRIKISTPFDFNHISHINNDAQPTVNSIEDSERVSPRSSQAIDNKSQNTTNAFAFNTTLPQETPNKGIPRSTSNATSMSSHMFTRSASISTMATTVSATKSRSHSSRLNSWAESPKQHQQSTKRSLDHTDLIHQHQHTSSNSSIENLKKFEKVQANKQCAPDYTSNFKFPDEFQNWDTSESTDVVRQSWIYNDLSPSPAIKRTRSIGLGLSSPRRLLKRSSSFSTSASGSPIDLNLFQNEMEASFINRTELDYKRIMNSIDDFKDFLKHDDQRSRTSLVRVSSTPLIPSLPEDSEFQSIKPIHSSLDSPFLESKTSQKAMFPSPSPNTDLESPNFQTNLDTQFFQPLKPDDDLCVSDAESTPRQHGISTMLSPNQI